MFHCEAKNAKHHQETEQSLNREHVKDAFRSHFEIDINANRA
jgi:hypothetical protein